MTGRGEDPGPLSSTRQSTRVSRRNTHNSPQAGSCQSDFIPGLPGVLVFMMLFAPHSSETITEQVHLYGDEITHRWPLFILIGHFGQRWIVRKSSGNFWSQLAALGIKGRGCIILQILLISFFKLVKKKEINIIYILSNFMLVSHKNFFFYIFMLEAPKCGKRSKSSKGVNTFARFCKHSRIQFRCS